MTVSFGFVVTARNVDFVASQDNPASEKDELAFFASRELKNTASAPNALTAM
jgi:hypothetical protein